MYLVYEKCYGEHLYKRIGAMKGFTEAFVAQVAKQILAVLNYFGTLGVSYKELNPQRIHFYSTDPTVPTIRVQNPQLDQLIRNSLATPPAEEEMVLTFIVRNGTE